jgi:hypothetical protein
MTFMTFTVGSGNVLTTDASSIFGRISLGGECEAMPLDDVRQLQRENRRGGGGLVTSLGVKRRWPQQA